ncbi:MAG: hypothetical protein LC772_09020 [Chloroflexi bacterium]|nr:hypothetical protein [Chloroflexota bacterium]
MISLDRRPLSRSNHWDLKFVTHASNSGQALEPSPPGAPAPFVLRQVGSPPILTGGMCSAAPTRVYLGDRLLIEAYVAGGTWELIRQGQRWDFFCDTSGVRVRVGRGRKTLAVAHSGVRTPIPVDSDGSFLYPSGALAVEVID